MDDGFVDSYHRLVDSYDCDISESMGFGPLPTLARWE